VKGGGIVSSVAGHRVAVGNVALMEKENVTLSKKVQKDVKRFEQQGNSLVLTAVDGELKVRMGIRDQVRPGVKANLQELKDLGV
ncbi:cation-transporting P-type ATPase, partial [Enterococcus faecium]